MKPYALSTYRCPFSGEPLSLVVIEQKQLDLSPKQLKLLAAHGIPREQASVAVKEGFLYSERGGYWFPIVNFVPIFLDFFVDLHAKFWEKHGPRHAIITRLKSPDGTPREGETFVQKSFTREWELINLDALSFGLTQEQRDFFISLELDWPDGHIRKRPLNVLEVGCGSGFESRSLFNVTNGMIFGFDLNLALLQKGHLLADNCFINNAICSLFRLPLAARSFDVVYSSGVLHHTYSTEAALDEIIKFKKDDGLIYIWVYAREDAARSIKARIQWLIEDITRPRIARMPERWQNMIVRILAKRHLTLYKKVGGYNPETWSYADSEHSIRDLWTPLYAHRQGFNQVISWFLARGMDYRLIDPHEYCQTLKVPLIGIGIRGFSRADQRSAMPAGAEKLQPATTT
jgi:ubiquinone/menaquinone biosynthesis C-methylase UbiE/uncharacterized protein YbaR (Trm112 family)